MNELEGPKLKLVPDQIIEAEQKKEYSFLGSMTLQRGHKLFSIDLNRFLVTVVNTEITAMADFTSGKKTIKKSKVHVMKDHFYIGALNQKNAFRRFLLKFKDRIDLGDVSMLIYDDCEKDEAKLKERQWQFDVIDKVLNSKP